MLVRRRLASILMPVAVAALAACPKETALWILPGSTAAHLVFVRGERPFQEKSFSLGGLTVCRCREPCLWESDVVWNFSFDSASPKHLPYPSRIEYSVVPAGYVEQIRAQPLTPGCYYATAGGTGIVSFWTADDGSIHNVKLSSIGEPIVDSTSVGK